MPEDFDKITINSPESNEPINAQVLACFRLEEAGKKYLIYSTGKVDNGYEIINANELREDTLHNISDEEWAKVKEAMKKIIEEARA